MTSLHFGGLQVYHSPLWSSSMRGGRSGFTTGLLCKNNIPPAIEALRESQGRRSATGQIVFADGTTNLYGSPVANDGFFFVFDDVEDGSPSRAQYDALMKNREDAIRGSWWGRSTRQAQARRSLQTELIQSARREDRAFEVIPRFEIRPMAAAVPAAEGDETRP